MNNQLSGLILVLLAVGGYFFYNMEQEIKSLKARENSHVIDFQNLPYLETLEIQDRCYKQAEKAYSYYRGETVKFDPTALVEGFQSHYNPNLKKCLVEYGSTGGKSVSVVHFLEDPFERKTYAVYTWFNNKNQKYWEVKPTECFVEVAGVQQKCESYDDWNKMVKSLME